MRLRIADCGLRIAGGTRSWHVLAGSMILVLGAVGCGKGPAAEAGGGAGGGAAGKAGKPGAATSTGAAVTVSPASTGDIARTIDVTGSLVALQDVVVGTKQAGRVATVNVHEGDMVRAGQVVATMDTADLQAQKLSAEANVQAALTREQQAQQTYVQAQNALTQSRNQLSQAQNAVTNAQTTLDWTKRTTQSAVDTAEATVEQAKESLSIMKQGARAQERQQAEEAVSSAKANYDKAKSDLKRYQSLYRDQVVSASQLDQTQATFDAAQAQYNSAKAALSLVKEGARPEDIHRSELAVLLAQQTLTKAKADQVNVRMREEDLRTAKVAVQTAQANIRSAEAGVSSAKSGIAAAKAQTTQARAQVEVTRQNLNYATVVSPIGGYVAERRAEPGTQLGGGGAVIRIVDPNSVYFQATLPESDYSEVLTGMPVSVSIEALPETAQRPFQGRITRVLPVASAARNFTIRVDLTGDRRMRPQMFARGSILVDTHHSTVLVDKDSVLFDPANNKTRVFVAENSKAKERVVKVGYSNPKQVEILNGVSAGDRVITNGQTALQDGDPIKVQQ
jgi:HlyD family secretion protein